VEIKIGVKFEKFVWQLLGFQFEVQKNLFQEVLVFASDYQIGMPNSSFPINNVSN